MKRPRHARTRNAQDGFAVSSTLLIAGAFFVLIGLFSFNFFSPSNADTSISIEPRGDMFNLEHDITVDVFVVSKVPFNAIDAEITFPSDDLSVVSITDRNSIIDLWVREPSYSNADGTVTFTGGTTLSGGVVGKSLIATITFHPKKAGTVPLTMAHSVVLAGNGRGTDLKEETVDANFIVNELKNPAGGTRVVRSTTTDRYTVTEKALPSPDINGDGNYTLADLSSFLPYLKHTYDPDADFNGDGNVDLKDASIILSKIFGL